MDCDLPRSVHYSITGSKHYPAAGSDAVAWRAQFPAFEEEHNSPLQPLSLFIHPFEKKFRVEEVRGGRKIEGDFTEDVSLT